MARCNPSTFYKNDWPFASYISENVSIQGSPFLDHIRKTHEACQYYLKCLNGTEPNITKNLASVTGVLYDISKHWFTQNEAKTGAQDASLVENVLFDDILSAVCKHWLKGKTSSAAHGLIGVSLVENLLLDEKFYKATRLNKDECLDMALAIHFYQTFDGDIHENCFHILASCLSSRVLHLLIMLRYANHSPCVTDKENLMKECCRFALLIRFFDTNLFYEYRRKLSGGLVIFVTGDIHSCMGDVCVGILAKCQRHMRNENPVFVDQDDVYYAIETKSTFVSESTKDSLTINELECQIIGGLVCETVSTRGVCVVSSRNCLDAAFKERIMQLCPGSTFMIDVYVTGHRINYAEDEIQFDPKKVKISEHLPQKDSETDYCWLDFETPRPIHPLIFENVNWEKLTPDLQINKGPARAHISLPIKGWNRGLMANYLSNTLLPRLLRDRDEFLCDRIVDKTYGDVLPMNESWLPYWLNNQYTLNPRLKTPLKSVNKSRLKRLIPTRRSTRLACQKKI